MSYAREVLGRDIEEVRGWTVPGLAPIPSFGAHPDIDDHDRMIVGEFAGQSALLLRHALLVVRIRREIDIERSVASHRTLWRDETDFLVGHLDSRWLVASCDTIVDWWPDQNERSLALAGSLFTNTIKLYESERRLGGGTQPAAPPTGRHDLHDGLTAFMIGRGNMPANLSRRLQAVCDNDTIAGRILRELFQRANAFDTVFCRFRHVHWRTETEW